jgi:protein-disulfide isomerase
MDKKVLQLALALGIGGLAIGFAAGFVISATVGGGGGSRVEKLEAQIQQLKSSDQAKELDACHKKMAEALGPRADIYKVATIAELGENASLFDGLTEEQKNAAFDLMNSLRSQDRRQLGIAHCLSDLKRLRCQDVEQVAQTIIDKVKAGVDPAKIKKNLYRKDIDTGKSVPQGDPNAQVTVIEYSDFQCPYCKRAGHYGHDMVAKFPGKVKHYFKHIPLRMHPRAEPAARAATAAKKQGKFWEMHDILFENNRNLSDEDISGYAREIGLNVTQFETDYNSPEIAAEVKEDVDLAKKLGVRSTPTFFVNGILVRGAKPLPEFFKMIEDELAE